jgi:hypothetical protein
MEGEGAILFPSRVEVGIRGTEARTKYCYFLSFQFVRVSNSASADGECSRHSSEMKFWHYTGTVAQDVIDCLFFAK